ncbi:uncharacterized protein LOC121426585 [Lytechinus variegatus]|uniref:uncharacterized protein LOC121426585 n=1 Tax=Lytechinus variegatus TaxID=7654 RepID=UPI001BB1B75D|nr:uncharacterized protein LOC121426585 [Lytechinus variegatus]
MASFENGYTDISLAEATLSEEDRSKGWKVGFSEREQRVYFYNPVTCVTQWESPADSLTDGAAAISSQAPSEMEQRPILPKFPKGLIPPPAPVAAKFTKDIVNLSTIETLTNTPPMSTKRTMNEAFPEAETAHTAAKKPRRHMTMRLPDKLPSMEQEMTFSDDVHAVPLGDNGNWRPFLEAFLIIELFADVCRLMLPGPDGCDGCDHNYPTSYHACVNYKMPYHWNKEGIVQYLETGAQNLRKRISKGKLWNKWVVYFSHLTGESHMTHLVPYRTWQEFIKERLPIHVQDADFFLETYELWYERVPGTDYLALQNVIDEYNPNDRRKGFPTFSEEYHDIYGYSYDHDSDEED